ncbi:MAG: DNA-processing protein DprA [Armatimonadota bacterium]
MALCWGGGVGPAAVKRLLDRLGSAEAVLAASAEELLGLRARLSPESAERIAGLKGRLEEAEEELVRLGDAGIEVICGCEPEFPRALREAPNPPVIISVRGVLPDDTDQCVAIVGTRTPSEEGAELARRLAGDLASRGYWIVAGLALGVDTAAHEGALEGEGRTVAVLGSGIRVIHPRENEGLAERISDHGALLSELPPNARPSVARLMARNRLQAALSKAVIVVETREQGGTITTANAARRQGRLVYAVQWQEQKEEAAGNESLLNAGAWPLGVEYDLEELCGRVERHVPAVKGEAGEGQLDLF